jgi:hypothetical protein
MKMAEKYHKINPSAARPMRMRKYLKAEFTNTNVGKLILSILVPQTTQASHATISGSPETCDG